MQAYLDEVNSKIGPDLICTEQRDCFFVSLKANEFIDNALLNVSSKFLITVSEIGMNHFGKKPMFNNTRTTWWF